MRSLAFLALLLCSLPACASDSGETPPLSGGAGGLAGSAGQGAASGRGGAPGSAGATGGAGQGGVSGAAGLGGVGGAAGLGGVGGAAGLGGVGGAAGVGGVGGAAGVGGVGGASGVLCGDGVKEGEEGCDGADVGGLGCGLLHKGGLPPGPDGAPVSVGGAGKLACSAGCSLDTSRCDPPVRSIGSLGGALPGEAMAQLSESFVWDHPARVYRPSVAQRQVAVGAGVVLPAGPTLLAFDGPSDPLAVPAGASLPDYPYLRVDLSADGAPFYEPCWDYSCDALLPPRALRPVRSAPLLLRQVAPDAYVAGTGRPWVAGKGKIRLVVGVVYADSPMPDAAVAQLFDPAGAADSTSLAAVPPWFAARSKDLGLASPVEVEVVWSKVQAKLPAEQIPAGYDQCVNADWTANLAPLISLAPGDILVQFYWGPEGSQCASHALRSSRSYVLFARPSFFALPGLVVSGAHELMHLLGASDKYTDSVTQDAQGNYHGCWYPDSPPSLYDARDIMCHRVAQIDPGGGFGGFLNPPLHELVVSPLTAREVGWEDLDGDGVLEVDDACPWDSGC